MPATAGAGAPPERTLGKYTLLGRLARGGMGEILLARLDGAAGFEKYVVIKRLRRHLDGDERSIQAFLDEARIVARLSHPNVCQVHELGAEDGRYYLAMEYLEGLPLSGIVRRASRDRAPLDLRALGGMVEQACEGLHHVHTLRRMDGTPAAVLHRDVSPQNLFVTVDGVVKVLDFGIAKSGDSSVKTPTGRIMGKSAYMSPEQIRGAPLDPRSDVYSLGVVLYEAITGQPLFDRGDVTETFRAIREDTLPFLRDVPVELNGVVQRAVARDRGDRFETARAFGRAVGAAVAGLGGSMTAPQLAEWLSERFTDDLRERRERAAAAAAGRAGTTDDADARLEAGTVLADLDGSADAPLMARAGAAGGSGTEPIAPTGTMPLGARSDELWTEPVLGREAGDAGNAADADATEAARHPAVPRAIATAPRRRRWLLTGSAVALLGGGIAALVATRDGPALPDSPGDGAERRGGRAIAATPGAAAAPRPEAAAPLGAVTGSEAAPSAPPRVAPARAARRKAARGFFTVDSMPYATITIDGVSRGTTPLLRIPLSPGAHSVVAETADGRRRAFRVTIEPGAEAPRRRLVW